MKCKNNKAKSLIICTSILQMIIAEKIIELHLDQKFDLIVIAIRKTEKYQYYFDRLASKCNHSFLYILPEDKDTTKYFIFKRNLSSREFDQLYKNVYLASFDNIWVRIIVSKQKQARIYTFDDGLANIIRNSHFYLASKVSKSIRIKQWLIGAKLNSIQIKNKSIKHYTIYQNVPNIIANTEYIKIFDDQKHVCQSIKESMKVTMFVGQPLNKYGKIFNINYINNILNFLNIDIYYPHPKEESLPRGNFEIINSHLIFEEFLFKYLKSHPNVNLHIYSFYSSCLPNISNFIDSDRVKLTFIHNDFLWNRFKTFYMFADDKLDINHITIDKYI